MRFARNRFTADLETLKLIMEEMPVAIGISQLKSDLDAERIVRPENDTLYYNRRWREIFGFDEKVVLNGADATERLYPDPAYRAKMRRIRNQAALDSLRLRTPTKPIKIRARVADGTERMFYSGTTVIGDRFMVSMEEVVKRDLSPNSKVLSVSRSGSEEVFLDIGTIAAVLADRKYTIVLSGTMEYKDRRSIGEWEKILKGREFEKVDRSTLIKIPWIYAVQSLGRGAKVSFAHAAVTLHVGRVGRERLTKVLS